MPEMHFVDSTTIEAIGYDAGSRELYIQFVASGLYVYSDVDREIFEGLYSADSKGSYFNREIKARNYSYERRG